MDRLAWLRKVIAEELMGAEADSICGAAWGQRSAERVNRRNGYRERDLDTRVGTIALAVPKLREGSYYPDWLLQEPPACGACLGRGDRRVLRARCVDEAGRRTRDAVVSTRRPPHALPHVPVLTLTGPRFWGPVSTVLPAPTPLPRTPRSRAPRPRPRARPSRGGPCRPRRAPVAPRAPSSSSCRRSLAPARSRGRYRPRS